MIIGFGHRLRSGKDTAADHLVMTHDFVKRSWADPLKAACIEAFDWTEEHVYGALKDVVDPRWGFAPRHGLQYVGTNLFRAWIPDFWVRRTIMALPPDRNVVIPDVRFPNEAQAIKDAGGVVCRIDRPVLGPLPADAHESETAMAGYEHWDAVIVNDSDINHLRACVDTLIKNHGVRQ